MKPRKPVVPKPAPKAPAKPKKPKVDIFGRTITPEMEAAQARATARMRADMVKNSEAGRKNYKPGESTGRPDTDAARKAGFSK